MSSTTSGIVAASRIVQLATSIQENTGRVDRHLASAGLPPLSFDDDFPDLPPELEACRSAVLVATDELTDLMHGPRQLVEMFPPSHTNLVSSQAITRFGIAHALAIDEEASFTELARRCELPVDDLTRLVRHAIARHIFKEPRRGLVAHNAASRVLAEDALIDDWVSTATDDMWPAAARCVDAIDKWRGSAEPNTAGFQLAHGSNLPYFNLLRTDEKRQRAFANTMTYMATRKGFGAGAEELLAAFDWDDRTVVDMGGGQGSTGVDILRGTSSAKTSVVVQDLPGVINDVESEKIKIPDDLASRLTFMPHNFFEPQPFRGADVFLLRRILHDWSDQKAITILRNLVPALSKGTHIILQEHIIAEPGTLPFYYEKMMRNMDIAMKAGFNSKERDVTDWKMLFNEADERFRFVDVKAPAGGLLGVLIWEWIG